MGSIALGLAILFEGLLWIISWRRYQFAIRRFGIDFGGCLLGVLVFFKGGAIVNPLATVASRQTAAYVSHQYPYQGFHIRKRKYIPTSTTSGYFVYDCQVGSQHFILKTSYAESSNVTSFITEPVAVNE
jgi:hypothetical protein